MSSTYLHIALSSPVYIYIFQLHVIPELRLNNFNDWVQLFNGKGIVITTKNEDIVGFGVMLEIIQSNSKNKRCSIGGVRVIAHEKL